MKPSNHLNSSELTGVGSKRGLGIIILHSDGCRLSHNHRTRIRHIWSSLGLHRRSRTGCYRQHCMCNGPKYQQSYRRNSHYRHRSSDSTILLLCDGRTGTDEVSTCGKRFLLSLHSSWIRNCTGGRELLHTGSSKCGVARVLLYPYRCEHTGFDMLGAVLPSSYLPYEAWR